MSDLPSRASDAGPDVPVADAADPWELLLDASRTAAFAARTEDDDTALENIAAAEKLLDQAWDAIEARAKLRESRRTAAEIPVTGSRNDWNDRGDE